MMATIVPVAMLTFAAVLLVLGVWSQRNVTWLLPLTTSESMLRHKRKVLRRGSYACVAAALLLGVGGITTLVSHS